MEIVYNDKNVAKPLTADELVTGEVYKIDGADVFVLKVDLGSAGTRLIYPKSGTMVNYPSQAKYWPVKAKLIVN